MSCQLTVSTHPDRRERCRPRCPAAGSLPSLCTDKGPPPGPGAAVGGQRPIPIDRVREPADGRRPVSPAGVRCRPPPVGLATRAHDRCLLRRLNLRCPKVVFPGGGWHVRCLLPWSREVVMARMTRMLTAVGAAATMMVG